jgi:hypothetical protein
MSFGLCNVPSTFITIMNLVFHDKLDEFIIIYIDDILFYFMSMEKHAQHLQYVLQKLKDNKFYDNQIKSEFVKLEMDFLIHVLFQKGMRPNLKKVQTIKKWQSLVTTKGVKSFLDLVNLYRKFITFFFHIGLAIHGPL